MARAAAAPLATPAVNVGLWLTGTLIGMAWLVVVGLDLAGAEASLHHDALIEGTNALWLSAVVFVASWQVMTAAMMLPTSIPAVRALGAELHEVARPGWGTLAFLGIYFLAWTAFGVAAFAGDVATHRFVDAHPWLAERSWLVEASVLALAGGYQLLPVKRRFLAACRHPERTPGGVAGTALVATRGLRHSAECVASSGPLMLLMFAAGVANVWWMAALTAVMAYETMGRHGQRTSTLVGVVLIGLAGATVVSRGAIGIA